MSPTTGAEPVGARSGLSLGQWYEALPRWLQMATTIFGIVGAILFGSHLGLSWVEGQSALDPRMIRVEAQVKLDSTLNAAQQQDIARLLTGLADVSQRADGNRDLLKATYRGVLGMLCREDGGSPAACERRALEEMGAILGEGM